MAEALVEFCEHNGCGDAYVKQEMEEHRDDDGSVIYICMDCVDRMEDQTGFCSTSCQLGYGCDESC